VSDFNAGNLGLFGRRREGSESQILYVTILLSFQASFADTVLQEFTVQSQADYGPLLLVRS
jgi:hypothetical protein